MGCTAAEYEDFVRKFESAPELAEQMLVGSTWEIQTKKNPRPEGDDKIVKLIFGQSYVPAMTRVKRALGEQLEHEADSNCSSGDKRKAHCAQAESSRKWPRSD
jgi:hypothetical protein